MAIWKTRRLPTGGEGGRPARRRRRGLEPLPVGRAAGRDSDDEHGQLVGIDLVDDVVVTDSQAPESCELAFEHSAGVGLDREAIDR